MRYRPMKLTSCTTQHILGQQKPLRIERDTAIDVNCCWSNGCMFWGVKAPPESHRSTPSPILTEYVAPRYDPDICVHASTRQLSGAIVRCLGCPTAVMVIVSNFAAGNFSPFRPFRFRFAAGEAGRTTASNRNRYALRPTLRVLRTSPSERWL